MATSTPGQRLAPPAPTELSTTPATRGNWGRNREPGAAFRGLSRGRGAALGGLRRGRGGRGGGGIPREPRGTGDGRSTPVKVEEPAQSKPTADKSLIPVAAIPAKQKNPSRRCSRGSSASVASSNTEVSSTVSATTTTRSARRRRSQQHTKPPPASDKLTAEPNLLRMPRAHSDPSSPVAPSKDPPPHLAGPETTSFEMRTNIDALVERVRAVAMAENRPSTPGTHIDWAGDDDDSLPDLDDWGVTTTIGDTMSPIFVDGLKPLPDTAVKVMHTDGPVGSSSVMNDHDTSYDAKHGAREGDGATTPSVESISRSDNSVQDEKEHSKPTGRAPHPLQLDNPAPNAVNGSNNTEGHPSADRPLGFSHSLRPNTAVEPLRTPLHPSLPPKPATAVSAPRINVTVVRTPENSNLSLPTTKSTSNLDRSEVQLQDAAVTPAVEQSAGQTPSSALSSQKAKDVRGLAGSIHAPTVLEPSSAPSGMASYGSSSPAVGRFNPTHNRASTVGRLPMLQPHTAPANSLPGSGSSTPRRYLGSPEGYHTRTHSTPPTGHRVSHTRPVITGDAISRLARTLLPSRTIDVSASQAKE